MDERRYCREINVIAPAIILITIVVKNHLPPDHHNLQIALHPVQRLSKRRKKKNTATKIEILVERRPFNFIFLFFQKFKTSVSFLSVKSDNTISSIQSYIANNP